MQEVFKRIALVRRQRCVGADHRRKRHRQGTGRPGHPPPFARGRTSRSSRSIWRRSARRWSKANCSATSKRRLHRRRHGAARAAGIGRRRHGVLRRSGRHSRPACRSSCCACWNSTRSRRSATTTARGRATFAPSPPPTASCGASFTAAAFAKICIFGWPCSKSRCRSLRAAARGHSAVGRAVPGSAWPGRANAAGRFDRRGHGRALPAIAGPATSASCATPSSTAPCWPARRRDRPGTFAAAAGRRIGATPTPLRQRFGASRARLDRGRTGGRPQRRRSVSAISCRRLSRRCSRPCSTPPCKTAPPPPNCWAFTGQRCGRS